MKKKPLIAFNNKPKLKEALIAEMKKHIAADAVVQGLYGDFKKVAFKNFKGCGVGCTVKSYSKITKRKLFLYIHSNYELFGIPADTAEVEDTLFESLNPKSCINFPLQLLEAIPVGADLTNVILNFQYWLLTDKKYGLYQFIDSRNLQKDFDEIMGIVPYTCIDPLDSYGRYIFRFIKTTKNNKHNLCIQNILSYYFILLETCSSSIYTLSLYEDTFSKLLGIPTQNYVQVVCDKFLQLLRDAPLHDSLSKEIKNV